MARGGQGEEALLTDASLARLSQFDAALKQPVTEWLEGDVGRHLSSGDRNLLENALQQSRVLHERLLADYDKLETRRKSFASTSTTSSRAASTAGDEPAAWEPLWEEPDPSDPPADGACYVQRLPNEILQHIFSLVTENVAIWNSPYSWQEAPQKLLFRCLLVSKQWCKASRGSICRRITLNPVRTAAFQRYLQLRPEAAKNVQELSVCIQNTSVEAGYVTNIATLLPSFGNLQILRLNFTNRISPDDIELLLDAMVSLDCLKQLLWPRSDRAIPIQYIFGSLSPKVSLQRLMLRGDFQEVDENNWVVVPLSLDISGAGLTHLTIDCKVCIWLFRLIETSGRLVFLDINMTANDDHMTTEEAADQFKVAVGRNAQTLRHLKVEVVTLDAEMAAFLDPHWPLLTLHFGRHYVRDEISVSKVDLATIPLTVQDLKLTCPKNVLVDVSMLRDRVAVLHSLYQFVFYGHRIDPDLRPDDDVVALQEDLTKRGIRTIIR